MSAKYWAMKSDSEWSFFLGELFCVVYFSASAFSLNERWKVRTFQSLIFSLCHLLVNSCGGGQTEKGKMHLSTNSSNLGEGWKYFASNKMRFMENSTFFKFYFHRFNKIVVDVYNSIYTKMSFSAQYAIRSLSTDLSFVFSKTHR